ncbi:MAG: TRAP transporter large permease subunit, partial [Archaeoglobaceae archaeon]
MKSKSLSALLFIFCFLYFSIAIYYYTTGSMGTMFWALVLVPIGFAIYTLTKLKKSELYPRLGKLQYLVGAIYISLCVFSAIYLPMNYLDLIYYRAGSYNLMEKFVGVSMFLLIAEYARREHKVLFGLLIFLIIYCMFGEYFPGFLRVPSIDLERLILSSTVEIKLGMFGSYAQAGVGIIGAFLLLMGVAKGFGIDRALIKTIISILGKKPTLIPQSAVLGSMSVAMCTGSGAADSALVGQFTIPAMKRAGFPALYAAATEGSAALGGLIMPPVMAIAAFLMAEFLAVSYFEVMIRGFVLAFIYYISIILTVY